MSRVAKQTSQKTVADWAMLRPPVTDVLLADVVRRIVEQLQPEKIVLFGSFAYGTPDLDSDVDLLVVMDSQEPMTQRIRRVADVAKVRFLPMDIIVRTPAEMDERLAKGDFFMAEILTKGKVLYQRESR